MKLINILKRLWCERWVLRSLPSSIYFNFHYLPFKQAMRLPIWLYKPHFLALKGKIIILGGGENGYDTFGTLQRLIIPQFRNYHRESRRYYCICRKMLHW